MARTPSTMLELGTPAPAFRLPDFDGGRLTSDGGVMLLAMAEQGELHTRPYQDRRSWIVQ